MSAGTLYIVGTPIGHLQDITLRALEVLRGVSLIAAEDTRRTRKLLTHFEIATSMTAYHEHNAGHVAPRLIAALERGESIALVTDAGMPVVSDPGALLVAECHQRSIPVSPIPGPSAITAALAAAGFDGDRFVFEGFLPRQRGDRKTRLEALHTDPRTLVFFEAPSRINATLRELAEALGDREACVMREGTKAFEEIRREPLSALLERFERSTPKGEFTLVVAGHKAEADTPMTPETLETIEDDLRRLLLQGMSKRDAVNEVARLLNLPRNAVYRASLSISL